MSLQDNPKRLLSALQPVEADLVLEYEQRSPVCVRAAPTVYGDSVLACLKYNCSQSLFENRISGVYHVAAFISSITTATL